MFLVSFRVENIAAIIFCTSRLASPLQTWETLLKITNKGHLQMLQKGGILPCVDCAGFGKWNYSTVLFNKVQRSYCSNWCLCTVITLWTNALDKFNLIRFPWQMSHEKSILGAAICQVRITCEFFSLLLAKAFVIDLLSLRSSFNACDSNWKRINLLSVQYLLHLQHASSRTSAFWWRISFSLNPAKFT